MINRIAPSSVERLGDHSTRPSTSTTGSRLLRRAYSVLAISVLAAGLAGCDKCGDWFWIDGTAPHSCKGGPQSN